MERPSHMVQSLLQGAAESMPERRPHGTPTTKNEDLRERYSGRDPEVETQDDALRPDHISSRCFEGRVLDAAGPEFESGCRLVQAKDCGHEETIVVPCG